MKIATVSHSHVHLRQQLFFREVARQGHEVLMVAPGEWGQQKTAPQEEGGFRLATCRHMGGENIYDYRLLGAGELVEAFAPDWLYVQAEPGSATAQEAAEWAAKKRAIFTWENIALKNGLILMKYDMVVAGNPEAADLLRPFKPEVELMLQVGVDIDHFAARPGVARDIPVGYIGRAVPEKGLPYLTRAWPIVRMLPFTGYKEMPWRLSEVQVVVAYSQDVPQWKEQAPNYVVLESLLCGCKAVTSDTAAMAYWLAGCPGVVKVEGHEQSDPLLRPERITNLYKGIVEAIKMPVDDTSRAWVAERFGNKVMAERLLKMFEARS